MISESQNNICVGTSIIITAKVTNEGTGIVYKWKRNNIDAGLNNPDFTFAGFKDSDVVICEYISRTACGVDTTITSNKVIIRVVNDVAPLITVSNYDPLVCEGNVTTFTTTSFYGNEIPFFQWTVNDVPVGNNSPIYTTSSLTNGAKVKCTLTISSPSCPGSERSATSQLTLYVYPLIHPKIEIKPSKTNICKGETILFTALANGGPNPALNWKINGISTGETTGFFSSKTLQDGDVVTCIVTVDQDSRCKTGASASSDTVVIHVRNYPQPSITIAASLPQVCVGKPATFTSKAQNAGNIPYYEWQINGQNVASGTPTFIYNKFNNGDKVSCNLTTNIPGCPLTAMVSSNMEKVTVIDTPLITFSPPEFTILAGEQASLNASVSGSLSSYIWKPAGALVTPISLTPLTIPLFQDTVFNLSVLDINGCAASKDLQVKVLHKLYMPTAFTPNSDGKNDLFRIPQGTSLLLHGFSVFDRWGSIVFTTNDISQGWNGKYLDQDLSSGIYVYTIKGIFNGKEVLVKGTVFLMR
ncbi:MAG: gliding motility-associated C-terminal domain-containing protein [Chitinophagaceae bacterium]|nr:gliding motility-associated C-terminal domain-containing protein [Chitinophagaceae bacterium]